MLKEIASGKLFEAEKRVTNNPDVSGEPLWEISNVDNKKERKTVDYFILTEKYLAEETE